MQTSCSGNPTVSFHAYSKLGEKTFNEQTLDLRLCVSQYGLGLLVTAKQY